MFAPIPVGYNHRMPDHRRARPHLIATVAPEVRAAAVERAAREGVPLARLVEAAVRLYLASPPANPQPAESAST